MTNTLSPVREIRKLPYMKSSIRHVHSDLENNMMKFRGHFDKISIQLTYKYDQEFNSLFADLKRKKKTNQLNHFFFVLLKDNFIAICFERER